MTVPASPSDRRQRLRVLVVDDSIVQRNMLMTLLAADAELEIVGWAANGAEAIRVVARLKPDVITMDLRMPGMDGLEASRRIMQETPTPIVMVTASASREMQPLIFAALQAGVLAIVAKPLPGAHKARDIDELLWTVKSMAQVRVIRHWTPERLQTGRGRPALPAAVLPTRPLEIVAIGASTGGPGALQEILTQLPSTFPLPILVVQHIGHDFLSGLIDWLTPQCGLPIRLVSEGMALDPPGIYFAPHDRHLSVRGGALALTDDPAIRGHRPSATILFKAVAAHYRSRAIGVLLTGMGDDGATGLRDLKNAGGVTIAQDEASSVVFGMPAAAIALGIVDYMLSPSQIGPLLIKLASVGREDK